MKTWKQRWEDELDAKIPSLSEEVKNEPIAAITTDTTQESSTFWQGIADVWQRLVNNVKTYRKRWMTAAASCMAAIVALCVCLPYLFPSAPVLAQTTVLALEINPQVFFSVDEVVSWVLLLYRVFSSISYLSAVTPAGNLSVQSDHSSCSGVPLLPSVVMVA